MMTKPNTPHWQCPGPVVHKPARPYWDREEAARRADEYLKLLKRIDARLDAAVHEVARARIALVELTHTAEEQRANADAAAALDTDPPLI